MATSKEVQSTANTLLETLKTARAAAEGVRPVFDAPGADFFTEFMKGFTEAVMDKKDQGTSR